MITTNLMILFKLTRTSKGFFKKSGWLLAELLCVFIGMYGAFILERNHEKNLDDLRSRQILEALIDEFAGYEEEISSFKELLQSGYTSDFFKDYTQGKKPALREILAGGMGTVNTGTWEAILQSGGIELLDVAIILEIQSFLKNLQDILDLYSRFERQSDLLLIPELDRDASFFYEPDGIELRNKYKWYVNYLWTISQSLGKIALQAKETRLLLIAEFKENFPNSELKTQNSLVSSNEVNLDENSKTENEEKNKKDLPPVKESNEKLEKQILENLENLLKSTYSELVSIEEEFAENYAIPFLSLYQEGKKPKPQKIEIEQELSELSEHWKKMVQSKEMRNLDLDIIQKTKSFFTKANNMLSQINGFKKLSEQFAKSGEGKLDNEYYDKNGTELRLQFQWYPEKLAETGGLLITLQEDLENLITVVSEREASINNSSVDENATVQEVIKNTAVNLESGTAENLYRLMETCHADMVSWGNEYDEKIAFPFFRAYKENKKPPPKRIVLNPVLWTHIESWETFYNSLNTENRELLLIKRHNAFFANLKIILNEIQKFAELTKDFEDDSNKISGDKFYDQDKTDLNEKYNWYPDQLSQVGNLTEKVIEFSQKLKNEAFENLNR